MDIFKLGKNDDFQKRLIIKVPIFKSTKINTFGIQ
jgi:hypothetical protein